MLNYKEWHSCLRLVNKLISVECDILQQHVIVIYVTEGEKQIPHIQ